MYKIFRNILIVVTVMLCAGICVSANPEFEFYDDMIIKYNGNANVVTIPAVIDGVEIAGIDPYAFENKDMHTVIIEEGIEVIRPKAFVECKNLQYVKSPESMLLINDDAFFECHPEIYIDAGDETCVMAARPFMLFSGTQDEIDATTGDTTTGDTTTGGEEITNFLYSGNTITGYIGVDTDIVIPESIEGVTITAIGASAFIDNIELTSVIIPDTVTTIGNYAFKGCTSLATVTLSKNLSVAGTEAFMNCTSLKKVTIPGTLKKIPTKMFYICTSLEEVVLEEGVEKTGSYAFCECGELKSVSIPSTIKGVDVWSFGNCVKLESFSVPVGTTYLDSAALYRCKKIPKFIVPDTVTSIGTHAFRGCSGLINLKLSENINRISYRALNGCGFEQIKIPEKVMYIDDESFYQCQKLTSIEIPDGVTLIGKKAFYGCFRMTECTIFGEDVTFGTDAFFSVAEGCKVWIPENSNTQTSAEENGIVYYLIKDDASVAEQSVYINGAAVSAGEGIVVANEDTISVKYELITADDEEKELFFAFLRFGENGKFLGLKQCEVKTLKNSQSVVEESFEVTDEKQIKAILFSSIQDIKAMCAAVNFFVGE